MPLAMSHQPCNDALTVTVDRTRRSLNVAEASALLARTPRVLDAWLRGLPEGWLAAHEGGETWNPVEVVGHLLHGERTDWLPRIQRVLEHGESVAFDPYDRFAQVRESEGKTLSQLLDAFAEARDRNLRELASLSIDDKALAKTGKHPAFGTVTLAQLLATWVAHDLDHITQIARVMARQYSDAVGPWRSYLRVISGQQG